MTNKQKPIIIDVIYPYGLKPGFMNILPIIFNKKISDKRSIGVIPKPHIYYNQGHITKSHSHIMLRPSTLNDPEFVMRDGYIISENEIKEKKLLFQIDRHGKKNDIDQILKRLSLCFVEIHDLILELEKYYILASQRTQDINDSYILATDEGRILANSLYLLNSNNSIQIDKYSDINKSKHVLEKIKTMLDYTNMMINNVKDQ